MEVIRRAALALAAAMLATVGLAAAYGAQGVRVNAINPGGTLTGRVQEGLSAEARMTGLSAGRITLDSGTSGS